MKEIPQSHGFYFEEFQVGQTFTTPGRTISEADIINFAGLSGDFDPLHTDEVYASSTPFGQRVAHGLLGLAIASGLAMASGFLRGTVLAFREIQSWKFTKPVFIGDTISVALEIEDKTPLPRLHCGALVVRVRVKNQQQEIVMGGRWIALVKSNDSTL
jgi:acyl dehydratase